MGRWPRLEVHRVWHAIGGGTGWPPSPNSQSHLPDFTQIRNAAPPYNVTWNLQHALLRTPNTFPKRKSERNAGAALCHIQVIVQASHEAFPSRALSARPTGNITACIWYNWQHRAVYHKTDTKLPHGLLIGHRVSVITIPTDARSDLLHKSAGKIGAMCTRIIHQFQRIAPANS
uniref:Uncharacterized protein n=1 Tax=Branchiostoma floridae TaxID=7739 RepID=C3Y1I1_BRAFL|eukprot:XP_002609711.1 hypothetical protein BRAFLDRAFT_102477 [Branchiostoma floridae]